MRLIAPLAALAVSCAGGRAHPGNLAASEWDVDSGGMSIRVFSYGGGPTTPALVVIHGGPGLSHDYLAPLERLATSRLRVVTYDQRNVGRSGRLPRREGTLDPSEFSIAKYVADLEAVIASLHAPRVHLMGHSWGGMVAQAYVAAHPDALASLSLVSAIPPTAPGFQAGISRMQQRVGELQKAGLIPEKTPPPRGEDCSRSVEAIWPAYFADPKLPVPPELKATSCHAGVGEATGPHLNSFDYREALSRLKAPALVLDGKADPFGLDWATESAAALSGAKVEVVTPDACGHFPWAECPQAFYAAVERILGADR